MANIGTTTAFYKVETSSTRANNEVSKHGATCYWKTECERG